MIQDEEVLVRLRARGSWSWVGSDDGNGNRFGSIDRTRAVLLFTYSTVNIPRIVIESNRVKRDIPRTIGINLCSRQKPPHRIYISWINAPDPPNAAWSAMPYQPSDDSTIN